jgi:hypothetical protein
MRATRILITMCCALAIATMFMATGARADEYTKQTFLTFSGPVQVPGMTLPAGTYMFKLADPESGRRAIQIWDEKGTKLFTMLLTVPDEQPEPKDDPVVLFSERPSGAAPAVKSWFYPAERTGYEFIYPKDQAMKIAAATNTPVLSYDTDVKSDADENSLRGTKVGHVDAQGQASADKAATASTTTASTTTTTSSSGAPAASAPARTDEQANRTQPPAAAPAAPSATTSTTASNTAAASATSTSPDANRTSASPAAPAASSTTSTTASARRADTSTARSATVGTSGQADRPAQSQTSQPARANGQLPRTASPLATLQLLSAGLLVGALGVRQLRRRYAENR